MSAIPGRYDIRYEHEGLEWYVEIPADSFEDAEAKLAAIAKSGRVAGLITESVYVRRVQ